MTDRKSGNVRMLVPVALAAVIAASLFFVFQKLPPRQALPAKSETEILAALVSGWPALEKTIPARPVLGSAVWSPPSVVQFLSRDKLLLRFEDGHVVRFALFSYDAGRAAFSLAEMMPAVNELSPDEWRSLEAKYGDTASAPRTFEFSPAVPVSSYAPGDWKETAANPFAEHPVPYQNGGISFAYSSGWRIDKAASADFALRRDYPAPESGSPPAARSGLLSFKRLGPYACPCGGSVLEDFIVNDAVFDASGAHPDSIGRFQKAAFNANVFYKIRTGRFEGVLSYSYYLPAKNVIYRFSASSFGVDWTNSALDEENDPTHLALKDVLATVKVSQN